jgi:hypothetical protein
VADRVDYHSRAPGQGEDTAIQGAGLGAVVPVNGAGGAQAGQACRGARAGAAPAMHRQRSFPLLAGARQGQPARVRAPQRGASPRLGLPRRFGAGSGTGADGVVASVGGMGVVLAALFPLCSYTVVAASRELQSVAVRSLSRRVDVLNAKRDAWRFKPHLTTDDGVGL